MNEAAGSAGADDQDSGTIERLDGPDNANNAAEQISELTSLLKIDEGEIIRAAGCLVYREANGQSEVLVVHRPQYDDWDLPKGKREDGETDLECAIRETREETGFGGEIERELSPDHYLVRGRDKVVRWWVMRCTDGAFVSNSEVDEIRWLAPAEAQNMLSYGHARNLIDEWSDGRSGPEGVTNVD